MWVGSGWVYEVVGPGSEGQTGLGQRKVTHGNSASSLKEPLLRPVSITTALRSDSER